MRSITILSEVPDITKQAVYKYDESKVSFMYFVESPLNDCATNFLQGSSIGFDKHITFNSSKKRGSRIPDRHGDSVTIFKPINIFPSATIIYRAFMNIVARVI